MNYLVSDRKNFPTITGVYLITFKNSNKVYVGSATVTNKVKSQNGFYGRWSKHLYNLRNHKYVLPLQNAYDKYGEDNMVFKILEICEPETCLDREQFYIELYNSYNYGYNGRPIASNNKGFKQTENQKNKIYEKYKLSRDFYSSDVKKLYNEGKTTREISNLLNISRGVITKIFKENNIKPRKLMDYIKIKIYQYDMYGNFINEWDSIKKCSDILKINSHGIQLVLHKKCKQHKGYYFNYNKLDKEDVLKNINNLKIKNKKFFDIKQIDLDGNIIKIWKDVNDILDTLNFSIAFYRYLNNNNLYKGYYWKTNKQNNKIVKTSQIHNLVEFFCLFLSGSLNLPLCSQDYIYEKYNKYIGAPIKKHGRSTEIGIKTSNIYNEWSKNWNIKDEDIETIFLFLRELNKAQKIGSFDILPDELITIFEKYIGEPEKINEERYSNIHTILKDKLYLPYVEKHKRYFKLVKILEN